MNLALYSPNVHFSIKQMPAVTALKYRGGLQLGVGMSTGHVSYSPSPVRTLEEKRNLGPFNFMYVGPEK